MKKKKISKIIIVILVIILVSIVVAILNHIISQKKREEYERIKRDPATAVGYLYVKNLEDMGRLLLVDCDTSELTINTDDIKEFYLAALVAYANFNIKDREWGYSFSEERIIEILKNFKNIEVTGEEMDYIISLIDAISFQNDYFYDYYDFYIEVMVNLELMYYKDEDSIEFDNHHDIYIYIVFIILEKFIP